MSPRFGAGKGQQLTLDVDRADDGDAIRDLLPFLWPKGRPDLKRRVVLAMIALVLAKAVTVGMPYLYKAAVDSLDAARPEEIALSIVLSLIAAYGVARILMIGLAQLRDGLFARVGQNAVRAVGLRTFRHLHALSLRFHLSRRTGGLSRVIERGVKAIEFLLRFTLFNVGPTILELLLVAGLLWWPAAPPLLWVLLLGMAAGSAFPLALYLVAHRARSATRADHRSPQVKEPTCPSASTSSARTSTTATSWP